MQFVDQEMSLRSRIVSLRSLNRDEGGLRPFPPLMVGVKEEPIGCSGKNQESGPA